MNSCIILYFYPAMYSSDTAVLAFCGKNTACDPLSVSKKHDKSLIGKRFPYKAEETRIDLDLVYIKI